MPKGLLIVRHTLTAVLTVLCTVAAENPDRWLGTWKLDLARSKFEPGEAPQSTIYKVEAVPGGGQKHIFVTIGPNGTTIRTERVTTFDHADSAVVVWGATASDASRTNSFRRIDRRSFEVVVKVDGQVTTIVKVVVSSNGKTMTHTQTGIDAQGQRTTGIRAYNKQ